MNHKKQFFSLSAAILALILINILVLKSAILGVILGLTYILYFGLTIGQNLLKDWKQYFQIIYGSLMLLAGISSLGAIIYFFYQLNLAVILILLFAPPVSIFFYFKNLKVAYKLPPITASAGSRSGGTSHKLHLSTILIATLFLTALYLLLTSQTTNAVRSPWEVITPAIFIIYFLIALLILSRNYSRKNLFLTSLFFLLTFSVALIIYKLGFGYDPHIHQATENEILKNGLITPKPLYYLGQYSLVIFLSRIFQVSIFTIDKILVPLLAAILLPSTIYLGLTKGLKLETNKSILTTLSVLILPFSTFIVTTPQALGNLLILVTIFLFIAGMKNYWLLSLLTLTTLLIHPFAGIPLLIFVVFSFIFKEKRKLRYYFLLVPASILIPLLFWLGSLFSDQYSLELNSGNFNFTWPSVAEHTFSNVLELTYLLGINFLIIFIIFLIIGLIKNKNRVSLGFSSKGGRASGAKTQASREWQPFLLTFAAVFVNFIRLKFIDFPFLIEHEQNYYPKRVLEISLYFLLPLFLLGIYYAWARIEKQKQALKLFAFLIFAGLITISFYLSYPVKDKYRPSPGFNLSSADLKAVELIQNNASEPYVVLANQMTSVAAVKKFGFGNNFYLSIPTASPLYEYYLKMVYKNPNKKTIEDAMDLMGVELGYFVINDYWWGSEDIVEIAKLEASDWWEVDGGKVWVFKFDFKKERQ